MKASLGASMALGFILAIPLLKFPAFGASTPLVGQRAAHHHAADFAKAKAFVTPAAPALRVPESDGLSRDPDDCRYGCIDNGG